MRGNIAVRINDGYSSRHVTAWTKDLRFRKTASGGHHSAAMQVLAPVGTFRDLGPADSVYLYDTRTSATIWDGYTTLPGETDGPRGRAYEITALGGASRASDESRALLYIDRALTAWSRFSGSAPSAQAAASTDPADDDVSGLLVQFPPGQPIGTGANAQMGYAPMDGVRIGAVGVVVRSGKIDTGYQTFLASSTASQLPPLTGIHTTAAAKATRFVGDPGIPAGTPSVSLRLRRTGGATNVADDNTWTFFSDISVLGRRMDRHGTLVTGSAGMVTVEHVRADWVVEDLLGRVLTMCDPDTAVLDATTWDIDQLAYRDGVKAAQVLDDLALWEPDLLWEILERNNRGLHRFQFRAWPTTPRYEISTADGYKLAGGEVDLCNRIAVTWTDPQGKDQTTVVTTTVEALGSRIRDADPIGLPDGQGSAANAARIGQQVLDAKADPPKAATATVDHPILDLVTGRRVMPWELLPGYLARVRETGDDLRITEMEYVDSDCATTLTLGSPTLTLEQRVARLSRVIKTTAVA